MKLLLAFALAIFSFGTFASNKICVGEKVIVAFNEPLKKLVVLNKETLEILQSTSLEGYVFGEFALSADGSKIWFEMDGIVYCRDLNSGEILKEIQGTNNYKFEFSDASDYLIHFETVDGASLIYVYDLNTSEAISYAKVDFVDFPETLHYDHENQELHILSRTFASETEKPSKEPQFGIPETAEEIALAMLHDEKASRYFIYDIANKKVVHDTKTFYSPGFEVDFEVINGRLYLVTQVGTAEVMPDHSFRISSLVVTNLADYDLEESTIMGVNGFIFFSYSFDDWSMMELYDDEINKIIIEAHAFSATAEFYYAMYEGIFYRFKRSSPMNTDLDIALD